MKPKRYCGKIGAPVRQGNDEACPECGNPAHTIILDEGECGHYVDGTLCALSAGHSSAHAPATPPGPTKTGGE